MNALARLMEQRIRAAGGLAAHDAYEEQMHRMWACEDHVAEFVRDEAAERVILGEWRFAYLYSRHVLKDRWDALEEAVEAAPATDERNEAYAVFNYARDVMEATWPAAEKHFANDPVIAQRYDDLVRREYEGGADRLPAGF